MEEDKVLSDSESDDSSDDANIVLEDKATELERLISDNKYLYDEHKQLVEIYMQLGDLTSMREAYERFHETYPLEPSIWLTWLKVEMKVANSKEERKNVLKLFKKAIDDYLSVPLWLEFVQFSLGCCELEETRSILERGLNAAGLHCAHGSLLWDALRELEMAHLSLADPTTEEFQTQLQRVIAVYKRQLSVPLLNMKNTYKEWTEFVKQLPENTADVKSIDWGYNKSLKTLDEYKVYEDRLVTCSTNEDIWVVYKEYIRNLKDPSVILCVYERAVEKLCLTPEVWSDYCNFTYNLGEVALKISERAIKHLTWDTRLWILRIRILEKLETDHSKVLECFEAGISVAHYPLDLWLTYLDYTKRNQPDCLEKSFTQIETLPWPLLDPTQEVKRYHARLKAGSGEMETARKLWNNIMVDPNINGCSRYWMEYINLERRHGKPQQLRALFTRAIQSVKDNQALIADEYLMYEREEGSVDEIMKCMKIVSNVPKVAPIVVDNQVENRNEKTLKNNDKFIKSNNKRKVDDIKHEQVYKKAKMNFVERNKGAPADLDPLKSVFISNIGPHVTEDRLKEAFPKARVTLATDSKGASRCFAFVQFETEQDAEEVLKRDREELNSRPMFISKCKTDRTERQAGFKYSTGVENNKLFVRGLPKNFTKEDVEKIFNEFNCTDVRLVLQKSGQSKGLAYVDFANDDDAERALIATDNKMFGVYKINVAVSAPPSTGNKAKVERREPRNEPKSRLQIPLIPQSVQKAQASVQKKSNADFRSMLLKQ